MRFVQATSKLRKRPVSTRVLHSSEVLEKQNIGSCAMEEILQQSRRRIRRPCSGRALRKRAVAVLGIENSPTGEERIKWQVSFTWRGPCTIAFSKIPTRRGGSGVSPFFDGVEK